MGGSFETERVEEMAILFTEQMSIAYPKGPRHVSLDITHGDDDEVRKGNIKEASISLQNMIDELPYLTDYDELKTAFTIAANKWKATHPQKDEKLVSTVGKPLSFIDQLQGGFALPISLEEIQEASSGQERLVVLSKINYLEDLLMDWNKICTLLRQDLSRSFFVNPSITLQLINLHRKWFDQGRSSSEYTSLLYGICENLIETLANAVTMEEFQASELTIESMEFTLVTSLVQNWREMWLDLMQEGKYSEDLAEGIEKRMLTLFFRPGSCKLSRMAQNILCYTDPSASWFHSWTNLVLTNDHLLSLLCGSESDTKILPEMWTRILAVGDSIGTDNDCTPLQLNATAVLSIVLCRTRLSQFPWDSFVVSNSPEDETIAKRSSDGINIFRTTIDKMLELFLRVVAFTSLDENGTVGCSNANLKIIALNGIEAILSGSQNDNDSDFHRRFQKVKSSLQERKTPYNIAVNHFLEIKINQEL